MILLTLLFIAATCSIMLCNLEHKKSKVWQKMKHDDILRQLLKEKTQKLEDQND